MVKPGSNAGEATLDLSGKEDRKSTRLNSSHTVISYAVFCLNKKLLRERAPEGGQLDVPFEDAHLWEGAAAEQREESTAAHALDSDLPQALGPFAPDRPSSLAERRQIGRRASEVAQEGQRIDVGNARRQVDPFDQEVDGLRSRGARGCCRNGWLALHDLQCGHRRRED